MCDSVRTDFSYEPKCCSLISSQAHTPTKKRTGSACYTLFDAVFHACCRQTLARLTKEKTEKLQQLLMDPQLADSTFWNDIDTIDSQLNEIFRHARFWQKKDGGALVEGNEWWDAENEGKKGPKMLSVRIADLARIQEREQDRLEAALAAINGSNEGEDAKKNRADIERTDYQLRLNEAKAKCTSLRSSPFDGAVIDGRYRVIGFLGAGSYGHAYRAVDLHANDAEVCIKVFAIPKTTAGNQGYQGIDVRRNAAMEDFVSLSRMRATLNHKNICNVVHLESLAES